MGSLCLCTHPICRLAGAAGTTVTCPLEVVKTRLQTAVGQNVMKTLQAGYRLVPTATSTVAMHSAATNTSTPMMYLRYALFYLLCV